MTPTTPDFNTDSMGECTVVSPLRTAHFMDTSKRLLFRADIDELRAQVQAGVDPAAFELAGPRERIYFNPGELRCGIVTCGGLCPGLNDVIRSIVFCLQEKYGVTAIYGFRFGYAGLAEPDALKPIELTTRRVGQINEVGGSVLGSSRGPQPVDEMVDTLERLGIQLLFTVGGDGTLRGAHSIVEEIRRRKLDIAVVGVPKTIDNDISYIDMSFGFDTAVEAARQATRAAFVEASCHRYGIGLVKLMGRDAGFIASFATLADTQVGLCLIPEIAFNVAGVIEAAWQRIQRDGYAVIVVAEGAGQNLLDETAEFDASGNRRHGDIGVYLKEVIPEGVSGSGNFGKPQIHRPQLHDPQSACECSGRQLLSSVGSRGCSRRHGWQDRHRDRFLATPADPLTYSVGGRFPETGRHQWLPLADSAVGDWSAR